MANFEPIILPSKKNQWKCSSKENLFESYLQLFTTWFTQKHFLQSFNILIEIECLILPHKFLLQRYTKKGIMLASFRFVSDSVTRCSHHQVYALLHRIWKDRISAEFEKEFFFWKKYLPISSYANFMSIF